MGILSDTFLKKCVLHLIVSHSGNLHRNIVLLLETTFIPWITYLNLKDDIYKSVVEFVYYNRC